MSDFLLLSIILSSHDLNQAITPRNIEILSGILCISTKKTDYGSYSPCII